MDQQRKELDLVKKLDEMNLADRTTHQPAARGDDRLHGDRLPHADGGAGGLRRAQGVGDAVIKMYGEGSTARGCLTAARLIEKGVRMVQVYYCGRRSRGMPTPTSCCTARTRRTPTSRLPR